MSELKYRRPRIVDEIPLDSHSVIEASAGTGKTFTIEHLVLRLLLEERAALDEILVVTFTEKATGDLRRRIRTRIDKVVSGHGAENKADGVEVPVGDEQRKRLESALFSFERAPIHTIHSFCQRTLSELAFLTGAPFEVEIVDARQAFHDAFRAELREGLARDPRWAAMVARWLADDTPDSLEQTLFEAHRHRYLDSGAPQRNAAAIDALIASFDARRLREDYNAAAIRADSRAPALAAIEAIENAIGGNPGNSAGVRAALGSASFQKLVNPTKTKNGKQFPVELCAGTRAFVAAADLGQAAIPPGVTIADAMLPAVKRRLEAQKRASRTMDYDDMLAWLARALEGPRGGAMIEELRRRYRYALIDEFQDTDDLQWSIFRRVFVDRSNSNFLCVIGDPKQAIYSFRGADVFTYLAAREVLCRDGTAAARLLRNYRSTQAMIERLEVILDQMAPEAVLTPNIPFNPDVICGKPELQALDARGRPLPPVTLLEYLPETPGGDSAPAARGRIGRQIAAILHKLLFDDDGRITIANPDDRGNPRRTVAPRDVFILTRTNPESAEIGGYLREAGVPYAFYKREGLFQTPEAYDILDALRAIEDPVDRSRRLKAWNSPFFAVPYPDLRGLGDVAPDHALNRRLFEWNELAGREQFAQLFDSMMTRSGLAYRELLFSNSERELTNYQHIFEILLEQTTAHRLSLAEIIESLAGYAAERAAPPGENSNVERLESERAAVQIMSVHMSKGLEADVVFLFGGFGPFPDKSMAAAYHDPHTGERRVAIGKAAKDVVKDQIDAEHAAEDRRLAYVALTRARAKMYLPVLADKSTKKKLAGYYRFINRRLQAVAAEDALRPAKQRLFDRAIVERSGTERRKADLRKALASFAPPRELLTTDTAAFRTLGALRDQRRALDILSYTALDRIAAAAGSDVELEDFKSDPGAEGSAAPEGGQLRGGRNVGLFLHEALERIDAATVRDARDCAAWSARPEVRQALEAAMRRHQVTDPRWLEKGLEIVFNAMRSPIAAGGAAIQSLATCDTSHEMEFVYPIPAPGHALLSSDGGDCWRIERGVLVGFVDLVFRHAGKTYFADWKSDLLTSYDDESVRRHVELNYLLQAKIYTIGVVRLLGIRTKTDYDAHFGGLLYIFLRGIAPDGGGTRGIYFHRPQWEEVVGYERELGNPERAAAGIR